MKTKLLLRLWPFLLGLFFLLFTLCLSESALFAEETAFTYQGRLNDSSGAANGLYDLTFAIYDQPTGNGGFAIQTNLATRVTNGLFTVTLDFGTFISESIFSGPQRWLEIAARTNGSVGYATLTPRERITATPYAITAANVVSNGLSGGIYSNPFTFNNPANVYFGNGGALANVNASTLGGLGVNNFWRTSGNGGTTPGLNFLGTTDNQPLELQVNSTRALRIEPHATAAPSLVGGYYQNSVAGFWGAVIAGGGTSAAANTVSGNYGFVGAGYGANAGNNSAIIAGAYNNSPGNYGFIGTGLSNTNQADYSFIGSGSNNVIQVNSIGAFIGGGLNNAVSGNSVEATISGGTLNFVGTNSGEATIGGGGINSIQNNAGSSIIGGGWGNTIQSTYATIGGGYVNLSSAFASTIAGGAENTILTNSDIAVIVGGHNNIIQAASFAIIGGGGYHVIQTNAYDSVIGGGGYNTIQANAYRTFVGGGGGNTIQSNAPYAVIGGGEINLSAGAYATIGGGGANVASGRSAFIGGGGGRDSGGSGPYGNTASGDWSLVSGGWDNVASGYSSTVGGGGVNQATSFYATIPGGSQNVAGGPYSFAAGQQARAMHQGTFVWADSQNSTFGSTTNDQFLIRAAGGVGINKTNPAAGLDVNGTARVQGANNWDVNGSEGDFRVGSDAFRFKIGVATNGGGTGDVWMRAQGGTARVFLKTPGGTTIYSNEGQTAGVSLAAGSGAWSSVSDRNAKENFISVDAKEILERVAALPLSTWNYKAQDKAIRHIGPMAQDFAAAFQVGEDEKRITTIDADGVALAAIQGLNQKVEEKDVRIHELEQRLSALEELVRHQH